MKRKLSPMQSKMFNLFDRFDKDIEINRMYLATYGLVPVSRPFAPSKIPVREMQMRIGPLIARINTKLEAGRIVPGELKQTYRLIRIAKEQ